MHFKMKIHAQMNKNKQNVCHKLSYKSHILLLIVHNDAQDNG